MQAQGQRLYEIDVMEQTLSALQTVISKISADYNKPPIPCATNSWDQREVAKQLGENLVYPYMSINLQNISRDRTGYNETLRRRGIKIGIDDDSNVVKRFRLLPVTFTFGVNFYSQDYTNAIQWAKRWLNRDKDVRFDLKFGLFCIRIKTILGDDIPISPPENTEFATSLFKLESNCVVAGYIGDVQTDSKIVKLVFNTNLISSEGNLNSATQIGSTTFVPNENNGLSIQNDQ